MHIFVGLNTSGVRGFILILRKQSNLRSRLSKLLVAFCVFALLV